MFRILQCAAIFAVIATSCPAIAQTAAGEWHGVITRAPIGEIRLDLVIAQSSPGDLSGTLTAPDQGSPPAPLADVTAADGVLAFAVPASRATFRGTWDATADAWVGVYAHPAGNSPTKFERGLSPPAPPLPAVAGLDGTWEATLQGVMPVIFRVQTDAAGTRAVMDVPAQRAANIPLKTLTREGGRVTFTIPAMMLSYDGQIAGDTLEGALTQAGRSSPLTLTRTSTAAAPARASARPQTPKPPYPYASQDVVFDNPFAPGIRLGCTLTTPPGAPAPVAILVSGSGPHDRNAEILGHQTFGVLADHLARNGIAALRCDDRDFGKPPEYTLAQTIGAFASDARAAMAFLRTRPDIDPKRIGFIGHSLGGVVAPVVASEETDTAFVVLLAGLGVTGAEAALDQRVGLAQPDATPAEIAEIRALWPDVIGKLARATDATEAQALVRNALAQTPKARPVIYPSVGMAVEAMSSAYARSMSAYDPAPYFAKIGAPVLALYGALDVQVPARQNLAGLRSITAGKDVTITELPGLNHAFQHARTGAMDEYATLEETFAPEALAMISDWIRSKTHR